MLDECSNQEKQEESGVRAQNHNAVAEKQFLIREGFKNQINFYFHGIFREWEQNIKIKGTFISSLLKVGKRKGLYVFHFWLFELRKTWFFS